MREKPGEKLHFQPFQNLRERGIEILLGILRSGIILLHGNQNGRFFLNFFEKFLRRNSVCFRKSSMPQTFGNILSYGKQKFSLRFGQVFVNIEQFSGFLVRVFP